jgi:putative selenate reductase
LKEYLGLSSSDDGFIFNMSVGYDLEGIKSEKVDHFINLMMDASKSEKFASYKNILKDFLSDNSTINWSTSKVYRFVDCIPSQISDSVTLSTMHGCPSEEIESITEHLISGKGLHTYIKLNPTLLGFERVKDILEQTGFNYVKLDKSGFEHDLQFEDAIPMIGRLEKFAEQHNKAFGLKLSNTLGVKNFKSVLSGDDMFMSGRSLFPLTINLASLLTNEFNGRIPISFSGGASGFNINQILDTGIYPVTLVTDLLKPGGYYRLLNISNSIKFETRNQIDITKTKQLADTTLAEQFYRKSSKEVDSIKVNKELPKFDCYMAPCQAACAIDQDIPQYINLIEQKRYNEAFDLITSKNPLPNITGYICDHQCEYHCTRWDYDEPLDIRDLKRIAAEKGYKIPSNTSNVKEEPKGKAAVIGAGPSGLSTAYFLAKENFDVTVFEKESDAGGVVQNVIPGFRLPESAIKKDIEFINSFGVKFKFNCSPDLTWKKLQEKGFQYTYLSIGAGLSKQLPLDGDNNKVYNAIEFLRDFRKGKEFDLGKRVAVIGGGNSAMDGARAALRNKGVEEVSIIYRRTQEFMPADKEEFDAALEDGVRFRELLLPVSFSEGFLKCQVMQLGEADSDGRRKVKPVEGKFEEIEVDSIISAIGESVDYTFLENFGLSKKDLEKVSPGVTETGIENVFIGGDALRGSATVVEAIADGQNAANSIANKVGLIKSFNNSKSNLSKIEEYNSRKGILDFKHADSPIEESVRCLGCDVICNKCVDVCPNRANIPIKSSDSLFRDAYQILHVDDLCNECGNCETFCPYQSAPYKDKITLFNDENSFTESDNDGFIIANFKSKNEMDLQIRLDGETSFIKGFKQNIDLKAHLNNGYDKSDLTKLTYLINLVLDKYGYLIKQS